MTIYLPYLGPHPGQARYLPTYLPTYRPTRQTSAGRAGPAARPSVATHRPTHDAARAHEGVIGLVSSCVPLSCSCFFMHRGEARPARRCVYATSTEVTRTTGVATYEARLLLPTYRYGVPWAAQAGYYLPT